MERQANKTGVGGAQKLQITYRALVLGMFAVFAVGFVSGGTATFLTVSAHAALHPGGLRGLPEWETDPDQEPIQDLRLVQEIEACVQLLNWCHEDTVQMQQMHGQILQALVQADREAQRCKEAKDGVPEQIPRETVPRAHPPSGKTSAGGPETSALARGPDTLATEQGLYR